MRLGVGVASIGTVVVKNGVLGCSLYGYKALRGFCLLKQH